MSIHKKDCVNVKLNGPDSNRWVKAYWADSIHEKFKSTIEINAQNRESLLADVSIMLSNMHIPIHALSAREVADGGSVIQVNVEVNDVGQLSYLINSLSNIKGVVNVHRLSAQ